MNSRKARLALLLPIAIIPVLAAGSSSREAARLPAKTVWDSVYTLAQAGRGESAYTRSCARCHGATLGGGDEASALVGGAFLGNWNGVALSELHTRIRTTMPTDSVGIYDAKLVTDVMAYLLKANGFPAGQSELPVETEALKGIVVATDRPGGSVTRATTTGAR